MSRKVSGKTNCSVLAPPGAKTNKELSRQNLKFKITTKNFGQIFLTPCYLLFTLDVDGSTCFEHVTQSCQHRNKPQKGTRSG